MSNDELMYFFDFNIMMERSDSIIRHSSFVNRHSKHSISIRSTLRILRRQLAAWRP
jgi:hypothetical protein